MTEQKVWIDDYLNKNQHNVIDSLNNDAKKLTLEELQELEAHEKKNDNRMRLLEKLKELIKGKNNTTKVDDKVDTTKKDSTKKGGNKMQYAKLTDKAPFKGGVTLPEQAGKVTVYTHKFSAVSEEAVKYLKDNYEKDMVEVIDQAEHDKRLKAQNDAIKEKKAKEKQ